MVVSRNFNDLFENFLSKKKLYPGALVVGKVIDIDNNFVVVDAGLKSEGYIPAEQFYNEDDEIEINIGDETEVMIDLLENGSGEVQFSRDKAKKCQVWKKLNDFYKSNETVSGVIVNRVKGGFTVNMQSVKAFLPGSLVNTKTIRDFDGLDGKIFDFKIIKMDQKRNNVIVSRRCVIESESENERLELLSKLQENQELVGIIKNLTNYGAFVDLGGVDGLLHITDMSWRRIKHPSEIVSIGDEVKVKILKFDKEKNRISLGLKQLTADPWVDIVSSYSKGFRFKGKVANITDYGCFVEIEKGIEGLVHISEMDWTNKNVNPNKLVKLGLEVEVVVLDIDIEKRRISLGMKQCKENPWDIFSSNYKKNDKVSGVVKSVTDFGIFVGLDGNIDGLVHLSDISWSGNNVDILNSYNKGDLIVTVVLGIDIERERISLGLKQLEKDPFYEFSKKNLKGDIINGTLLDINSKGSTVKLLDGVKGFIKSSDFYESNFTDYLTVLKKGSLVETKILNIDIKNKNILLSIVKKN